MNCEYCKKEFKNNSSLNLHVKTAKYCLKIQDELGINNDKEQCQLCLKTFTIKKYLKEHLD